MNKYYIFPFEMVPQNSKIVLYGAGVIGKSFYSQIQETGYCDILLWLDQAANGKHFSKPDAIKTVDYYDLVVIAIERYDIALEIKSMLINYGVPENKILHQIHKPLKNVYKSAALQTADDFLNKPGEVERVLIDYFYESYGDIDRYFSAFIDTVRQTISTDDAELNYETKHKFINKTLEIVQGSDVTIEAKLVLLRVMYDARCFSPELLKKFVDLTAEIRDNNSTKHWLLFCLGYMWFLQCDILYDGFFADRQNLFKDYVRELNLNWNPPVYTNDGNVNICVPVYNINKSHPANSFVAINHISPIVRKLTEKKFKVHIINLAANSYDCGANFMMSFYTQYSRNLYTREMLLPYFPEDIEIHDIHNAMMKDRQQDILDLICMINPYCILDFSDELAPISYYYSNAYPTVYVPIRKRGFSSQFFHKIVIEGKDDIDVAPPIRKEQVLRVPFHKERIEPKRQFNRSEYDFEKDDIVLITVGYRLRREITSDFAEQICRLLREYRRIKWVIVGLKDLDYINRHHGDLIGKNIVFIEYESDLSGLYGICDIYLNPNRLGGGNSIGCAMQQGLAIVSCSEAEAAADHMGKDNLLKSSDDLIPCIKQLVNDSEMLKQKKELSISLSSEWDINAYVDALVVGMKELTENFSKERKSEN